MDSKPKKIDARLLFNLAERLTNDLRSIQEGVEQSHDLAQVIEFRENMLADILPPNEINAMADGVSAGNLQIAALDVANASYRALGENSPLEMSKIITDMYQALNNPPLFERFNGVTSYVMANQIAGVSGLALDPNKMPLDKILAENFDFGEEFQKTIQSALYSPVERALNERLNLEQGNLPQVEVEEEEKVKSMGMS